MWFDFPYKFVLNKSHSKKNWAKYNFKKCIGLHVFYQIRKKIYFF
jgi:hypothetical protein